MKSTDVTWRKSSYSGTTPGNCVEVAFADTVGVRDSKDPAGPPLVFDQPAWRAFLDTVKVGGFHA